MAMSSPFLKELYSLPKHDKADSGNIICFLFPKGWWTERLRNFHKGHTISPGMPLNMSWYAMQPLLKQGTNCWELYLICQTRLNNRSAVQSKVYMHVTSTISVLFYRTGSSHFLQLANITWQTCTFLAWLTETLQKGCLSVFAPDI